MIWIPAFVADVQQGAFLFVFFLVSAVNKNNILSPGAILGATFGIMRDCCLPLLTANILTNQSTMTSTMIFFSVISASLHPQFSNALFQTILFPNQARN